MPQLQAASTRGGNTAAARAGTTHTVKQQDRGRKGSAVLQSVSQQWLLPAAVMESGGSRVCGVSKSYLLRSVHLLHAFAFTPAYQGIISGACCCHCITIRLAGVPGSKLSGMWLWGVCCVCP